MTNKTDLVLEKHFLKLSKKIMNFVFKFEPYNKSVHTYPPYINYPDSMTLTISIVIIGSTLRLYN